MREPLPTRYYPMPPAQRDRLIVQMRAEGHSLQVIGERVGMSPSGVSRALVRINEGGFGKGSSTQLSASGRIARRMPDIAAHPAEFVRI